MNLRVDISLSKEFGIVERTVFRLVLNGYTDASEIATALSLFSHPVVANGMCHLVNRQMLAVDMSTAHLKIAEPLTALMNMCIEHRVVVDIPDELGALIEQDGFLLDSGTSRETSQYRTELRQLKASLLECLLPGVNLEHYVDSLDFTLAGCEQDE